MPRTTTATTKGFLMLKFGCKGNTARRCRGNVSLDWFGAPAGSVSFSLVPGKSTTIPLKLRPKVWKRLLIKKRLSVDVTIMAPNGLGDVNLDTSLLRIVAPPAPAKHGVPSRRK